MAETRKAVFTALYEAGFPAVARHIAKRGGALEEAEDVFQGALLVYYEKSRDGLLHLERGGEAYIFGFARYLWAKRYREKDRKSVVKGKSGSGRVDLGGRGIIKKKNMNKE